MRIGVLLLPTYEWDKMVELSVRLEDAGYHHLWAFDHVSWQNFRDGPWHAAHPLLAGVER